MPPSGSACDRLGLECQYTDRDPRDDCNVIATCLRSGGDPAAWSYGRPDCTPTPAGTCPPTIQDAREMTGPCQPEGFLCKYDERFCLCTTKGLVCDSPPIDSKCPTFRPLLGTVCLYEGLRCQYGICNDFAIGRVCTNGLWTRVAPKCP